VTISDRITRVSSILNNFAALSALQALQMTQQSLATVENQVSTGLSVASAADNSSDWSIAAQLNADSGMVTASNDALSEGQSALATASATQDRITTANTFDTDLTTNYANGVAGLVDADMNEASTRLQALQTQEQLGIQSLSVANQNAALILKLFGG